MSRLLAVKVAYWIAALLFASFSQRALSAEVTLGTFPGGIFTNSNLEQDGFRISPNCHVDIVFALNQFISVDVSYGGLLGFDSSGCLATGTGFNPDYLGRSANPPVPVSAGALVYIDYFEHPFSLLSFEHVGPPAFVLSSKGGLEEIPFETCFPLICGPMFLHEVEGPAWTGIKWILLGLRADAGVPNSLFDNFRFQVASASSPGSVPLLLIGLTALFVIRNAPWYRPRRVPDPFRKKARTLN